MNYNAIIKSNNFNNVTFVVGNEKFPAIMEILTARSPVFTKMFETDMSEKKSKVVNITDTEPNVFKNLLNFIYFGEVESNSIHDCLKLLMAADKYIVSTLDAILKDIIIKKLSPTCVIDVLVAADSLNDSQLKKRCITYIKGHKGQVDQTEACKNLVRSHPDLFFELYRQV